MASGNIGISSTGITRPAPATILPGSKDEFFLDPSNYRLAILESLTSSEEVSESSIGYGFLVPQLEDIELLEDESVAYIDPKTGRTRAKLVFRVRNSSGQELIGVDVRRAKD